MRGPASRISPLKRPGRTATRGTGPIKHLLANVTWHALSGPHSVYSTGTDDARRYAPGFSPIVGFRDLVRPDFDALRPFCESGESFYSLGWGGPVPGGWRVCEETAICRMVWASPLPAADEARAAVRLGPEHVAQALELAALTHPGPFGPRTIELGEYFGFFEGQQLVAMAGERMHVAGLREISGVCTHPDFQGKGLARQLVTRLVRREMQRNETPFLHVLHHNTGARRLYERMGFQHEGRKRMAAWRRRMSW